MNKKSINQKVQKGRETADSLKSIARKAFAEQGYTETSTEQIIAEAGVTKGALYHHFPSKKHLFEVVYRAAEDEVAARIGAAAMVKDDPFGQLVAGCFAYLDACQDPGLHRILRIDGPAVMGLEKWAEIDREYGLDKLLPTLQQMADNGVIKVPSVEAFARQLTGAMNESTFWVVQAESADAALEKSKAMLLVLLEGVRT